MCVFVCVYGWVVGSVELLQGGAVYIDYSGEGTFTNCNFTSNSLGLVSLEENMLMVMRCLSSWPRDCVFHICLLDWFIPTSSICLLLLFPVIGDWFWCVRVRVRVCGWLVRWTCLQGGAVYIRFGFFGGDGTFTNCNFTSNSAGHVSLEEEHVDGCVWDVWVHDVEVVSSMCIFLIDSFLLPLSVYCDVFL